MSAYEWIVEFLAVAGAGRVGQMWQCPAHPDSYPSLSVNPGENGVALIRCHGGCEITEVVHALGLSMHLLFEPHHLPPSTVHDMLLTPPQFEAMSHRPGSSKSKGQPVGAPEKHIYVPGRYRLVRYRYGDGSKQCSWEYSRDGNDWWTSKGDVPLSELPLYRLQESTYELLAGEPIVLCESESSVDALLASGIPATTWAGGAGTVQAQTVKTSLEGQRVVIIPDNDPAGMKCLHNLQQVLAGNVASMSVITPEPGEDARDLLNHIGAAELLHRIQRAANP